MANPVACSIFDDTCFKSALLDSLTELNTWDSLDGARHQVHKKRICFHFATQPWAQGLEFVILTWGSWTACAVPLNSATCADSTPGLFLNAFSTAEEHALQVIPSTLMVEHTVDCKTIWLVISPIKECRNYKLPVTYLAGALVAMTGCGVRIQSPRLLE